PMRVVTLGEDDDAGGVAVEAVDNAGAGELFTDAGEGAAEWAAVPEVEGEGVDERASGVGAGGVDDDVGLLVEDDHVLVFKENVEGNVLWFEVFAGGRGDADFNLIVDSEDGGGLGDAAVDED